MGGSVSKLVLLKYTFFTMAGIGALAVIPACFIQSTPKDYLSKERVTFPQSGSVLNEKEKTMYSPAQIKNMIKLLIPLLLVGLGAGQVMPFLNIFIKGKFGINYQQLGWLFAFSSLFMGLAVLGQPVLSDKIGKINSVVLVQAVSIPFIFILGFSNIFWLVSSALLMRAALMNMGNPIYNVFAMEKLSSNQRTTFSSLESLLWSGGWAVSSWISGWIRTTIGFTKGFSVNFILMAIFYIIYTFLIYLFFRKNQI